MLFMTEGLDAKDFDLDTRHSSGSKDQVYDFDDSDSSAPAENDTTNQADQTQDNTNQGDQNNNNNTDNYRGYECPHPFVADNVYSFFNQ